MKLPTPRRIRARARHIAWRMSYLEGARLASELRKRWQVFRNPKATIRFGTNVIAGPGFKVWAPWGGTLIVGDDVEFRRNTFFELGGSESHVIVGTGCHFTYDVVIACGRSITIGDRVALGQSTIVVDGNHRFRDLTTPALEQGYDFRPVTIANDVHIHSKVTVINNIGERAMIGANAVVTKPVPPFTVAAGVPAVVVDYYGPPGQEPDGWPADRRAERRNAPPSPP